MSFFSRWQVITLFSLNVQSTHVVSGRMENIKDTFQYIIGINTAFLITWRKVFCTDLLLFLSELIVFYTLINIISRLIPKRQSLGCTR
jgi:hypothetical protein